MSSGCRARGRLPELDLDARRIDQPGEPAVVVGDRRANRLSAFRLCLGQPALQVFDDEVDHERRGRRIVVVGGGWVDAPEAMSDRGCLRPDDTATVVALEA